MRSYLDTIRKPVRLPLQPGEEIIMYYSASYDIGSSPASSWRLGNLYLTNTRLLFVQGRNILFKVLPDQIKAVNIVNRGWILGKKVKQLNIVSKDRKVPFIAIKDPENWKKAIEERTLGAQTTSESPLTVVDSQSDDVIIEERGGHLTSGQSRWKLGTILLTHKKLAFLLGSGIVWEIPLCDIKDLRVEKKIYGVSQSDTICVEYESFDELAEAWIITQNLNTWRKELYMRALLKVDRETLDKINTELDADSSKMLRFMYENRHARIDTLAKLIEASTHMDILFKIREIINPVAEKITGYPILSFERSKIDPETGEKFTFSWWLTGQSYREGKEPLLDIFDEGADLLVYLELSGIQEDTLRLKATGNLLVVDAEIDYHKEILLPAVVKAKSFTKRYKNNILQVRLKKQITNQLQNN